MKRKMISIGLVVLALALVFTLAPACGKDKEAKTLKIGMMAMLSGPGAAWGSAIKDGVEFALREINEAGGIKADGERYLLEMVVWDDKSTGSEGATGAQKFCFDDNLKFVQGPPAGAPVNAAVPIFEENNVISIVCAGGEDWGKPEHPYVFVSMCTLEAWMEGVWKLATTRLPEVKTVYSIALERPDSVIVAGYEKNSLEKRGITQIGVEYYLYGTQDFYPILTKIIAKNPDAISFCQSSAGDTALMIKQARELGYTGRLVAPYGVPMSLLLSVAGEEAAEGLLQSELDWTSPIMPQEMHDIRLKFIDEMQPEGGVVVLATLLYYTSTKFMAAAIEEADSLDVEKVIEAARAPGFKWQGWGFEASLGGFGKTGIRSFMPTIVGCSEVKNGELVTLGYEVAIDK